MVTTSSRLPTRTLRMILPDPALLDGSKLAPDKYPEYGMIGEFEMPGDEITEPGQNQRSVRSTCSRDRLPPRATLRRQRRPLVRPVVLRYRGHFGDDDPGSALGAALVVRTVPIGKRASHSKIGLVRTENNPGPDEASGQGRVFVECQLTALSEP